MPAQSCCIWSLNACHPHLASVNRVYSQHQAVSQKHNNVASNSSKQFSTLLTVQVFTEVFSREHQLMKVDPRKSTYLACCLLMRGKMSIADMNRNVARLKPNLRMVHWNSDGFKLGICSTPPVGINNSPCCIVWNQMPCACNAYDTMHCLDA